MNNSAVPYWLAFAALVVALYGGYKWRQVEQFRESQRLGEIQAISLPPLEKFKLTERSGEPFRSEDMKGQVWVVSFFFSTCPGSCARLNANIRALSNMEELKDVTWVSISVDPAQDTLEVLRKYADNLAADPVRWLFCRGEFDYVKRIAHDMLKVGGVSYQGHNDMAVVVDQQGEVAHYFNAVSTKDSERAIEKIKELLANPPASAQQADQKATPGAPPAEARHAA
jgi:protein SCO1/2